MEDAQVVKTAEGPPALSLPSSLPSPRCMGEEVSSVRDLQLSSPSPISSLLSAFLHRFSELFPLDHGYSSAETTAHGKRPKHLVEALWLKEILENCVKEVEKRVNIVCTDFLKKQNLQLMEEAISIATGHENDMLYMDIMLNKLRDQKIEKEKLLEELEPKYMAEMSKLIAERTEADRYKTMSIDELRKFETQTRAVTKIQKVWRGYMDRAKHTQELKKIAKKWKELRSKSKKEKKDKQGKDDGKKGGGKKAGKNKK